MKINLKNSQQLIPLLINFLITLLIFTPGFIFALTNHLINWWPSLAMWILQVLFSQMYYLFTKHKAITFLHNGLLLMGVEILSLVIIIALWPQLGGLSFSMLLIQWLLVHLVIIAKPLISTVPIITYASQILLAQNVFDQLQSNLFLTQFGIIPIVFNLSLAFLIAGLFKSENEKAISHRQILCAFILFIFWLLLAFFFAKIPVTSSLIMLVIYLLILGLAIYYFRKVNKLGPKER
ncbi:hypothetical protein [Aerococcus kribbianus]|uniref:Uncharacterized protein n=1 Tax=Aerococcus kribbianus TaxID=2999064 RepID=A0A9X3JEG3_9LACT|nr:MULTISPECIES: hypothetical protein [unclassified Aerococcus]MCZ0717094.1 hypothetical protein [Aerococcus sp. YH-aer221]MCZ0725382.1 hypothetical protein [Aerococcus sp. YH-aer222]